MPIFQISMIFLAYNAKSVFLTVNASLRWLNNASGVYLVQVSLLFIGPQGLVWISCIGPCFPWLEDYPNCTQTWEENDKYSAYYS
jgi:hypothetical protein